MDDGSTFDELLEAHVATWPTGASGMVVVDRDGVLGRGGDITTVRPWASVTKLLTALTVLSGVSLGIVGLEDAAGPPGSTVRHLLAHASGLSLDSDRVLAGPGVRRVYSNRGYEAVAEHLALASGRPFMELLHTWVLGPLGMDRTSLEGSPAHGAAGPVGDLALLARELLAPTALPGGLVADATTVAFPGLAGVLPGFGRQDPNDWGLGFEVKGAKSPHWTAPTNAPTTFGHFGQAGSFLWVDPEEAVGCASAGDTPFGPWAVEAWPRAATHVLDHVRRR